MKNPEVWHPDDRYMDSFGAMLDAALNMPVRNEANPHRVNPTVVDLRRRTLAMPISPRRTLWGGPPQGEPRMGKPWLCSLNRD
jgi:hypothetical protein